MKKFYLLLLLLQSHILLCAQEFNVSETKELDLKKDYLGSFVKMGNNNIRYQINYGPMQFAYTAKLKKVRYGIELHRYDEGMKLSKRLSLDNDEKNMGPFSPEFFSLAGKLHVLYYQFEDNDRINVFLTQIDSDSLSIVKTVKLFALNQDNVGIFKIEDAMSSNKAFASESPDKQKALIAHCNSGSVTSCIIDAQLNITHNTFIQFKDFNDFTVTSLFLDKNDNKYFGYLHLENKYYKTGVLTESNKGITKFQDFKTGESQYNASNVLFTGLKNNKVYAYTDYHIGFYFQGCC